MQAIRVELKGEDSELDGAKFDLIVVRVHLLSKFDPPAELFL